MKSAAEIFSLLDERGALDGLAFMPEMAAWCGGRFRVSRRADKTCDTVTFSGQRRLTDTVHLAGLRCDGSAHGGCQAGCLTFWKEAWLERVPAAEAATLPVGTPPADPGPVPLTMPTMRAEATPLARTEAEPKTEAGGSAAVLAGTRGEPAADLEDSAPVWSCQATRLLDASRRLRWWDLRQYVRDVRSRDVRLRTALRGTLVFLFNNYQNLTRRFFPSWLRYRNGSWYPFVIGQLDRTPTGRLDLQAGDVVEIRGREEIYATLDKGARNRGLSFDIEMVEWCGRRAKVLRRVDRIVDERTGKMLELKGDCIILEGVFCSGKSHGLCPRAVYPYWREIWLRRVDGADTATGRESVAVGAGAPAGPA